MATLVFPACGAKPPFPENGDDVFSTLMGFGYRKTILPPLAGGTTAGSLVFGRFFCQDERILDFLPAFR